MTDLLDIFGTGEIFPGADQALCAQIGGDWWFPRKGGSPRVARKVCAQCPVREACLAYALEIDAEWGVWGGKTEIERRKLRRGTLACERNHPGEDSDIAPREGSQGDRCRVCDRVTTRRRRERQAGSSEREVA